MANNLTQWKPGFWYDFDDFNCRLRTPRYIRFNTYRELKKNIHKYLAIQSEIHISRSRRGEFGEWFENWELVGGKPKIVKQGWM